ncbi:MAG: vitamin B12-dependent ribonucleotide reductase [Chloroflexota bacterium]|nr:vitamin B12-dependent ribonucleotide reductase [Chloroflexota bacterium]
MAPPATPSTDAAKANGHTNGDNGHGNGNGHDHGGHEGHEGRSGREGPEGQGRGEAQGEPQGEGQGKGTAATAQTATTKTGYQQLTPGEAQTWRGLTIERRYTREGVDPYDTLEWDTREAAITNEHGKVVFEQKNLEFPKSWSALATNVVASKYFRGPMGSPEREHSVKQMIDRVANTIADWGIKDAYFATPADAEAFRDELKDILLKQRAAFNSPVWFNVGIDARPQCSACFINSVQDTMESILTLAKTEGMLFKFGSGTGSNLSTLRSKEEQLRGGGSASGPVSFMKGFDAFAGVIKSGGKTRRAAKMVILNIDHPDVEEFIDCKLIEERKAWALIDAGYDGNFNGGAAYESVFFQNSNNSVRVTDEFMRAVETDGDWTTHAVVDGRPMQTLKARYLLNKMAEAAWVCGDPGIQYHDTVNAWHTSANTAPINASNPCSEYMYLDDSACNLASLNLMKFLRDDGEFDTEAYKHAVRIVFTAQEIIVDNASYPTPQIGENSRDFRPIGLGYANLGALLMNRGLAYDSDAGRAYAAGVTALMQAEAALQSSRISRDQGGPFAGYAINREPYLKVMGMHRDAAYRLDRQAIPTDLLDSTLTAWDEVVALGETAGFRNGQLSVLAPTGTIAFLMDCDTTGVEPDIALIKYKRLVGGGYLKIVNNTVPAGLKRLGYSARQIEEIVAYVDEHETIEGAPHLRDEHLAVFDCAFKPANGSRSIHYNGHLKMMAAVQPFISGAISKTVNMPEHSTAAEIAQVYIDGWKLGLKAIAVYRDNSKRSQPLNTKREGGDAAVADAGLAAVQTVYRPTRHRLPDERSAITHKFNVAGHEGYLTVGLYEDGQPGELFIRISKEGSTVAGMMEAFAIAVSVALQYGVPLKDLVNKFSHMRFEPAGFTSNPDVPMAKSIVDYIFRYLASKFLSRDEQDVVGVINRQMSLSEATPVTGEAAAETSIASGFATSATDASAAALPGADTAPERGDQGSEESIASSAAAEGVEAGGEEAVHESNGLLDGLKIVAQARDERLSVGQPTVIFDTADSPSCSECGSIMVRNGSCYKCINCGATSGCS